MKSIKSLVILVPFLLLAFTIPSFAHDTDLYVGGGSQIEPNIMIIFDNSGSMEDSPNWNSFCYYSYSYSYPQPTALQSNGHAYPFIDPVKVYKQVSQKWIDSHDDLTVFKNSVSKVECYNAQYYLRYYGLYSGYTNYYCNDKSEVIATGNYLRWLYADPINNGGCARKIDIARDVVSSFVSTMQGVRIGLMIFNYSEGGWVVSNIRGLEEKYNSYAGNNKTHREHLLAVLGVIEPATWTPLAETLYEAGLYFKGAASYFNPGTTYTSPIQYYCQKNHVIFMTDGTPAWDRNTILNTAIGDRDADKREPPGAPNDPWLYDGLLGSDFLDDVAKYLYDSDLNSTLQGTQNVVTYTIGFELDASDPLHKGKDLLQRTAIHGHGKFYSTSGAGGLTDAFANILNEVLSKTSSFVAPVVPVSKVEKTTAGDYIYLALFKPKPSGMWSGNLKKYKVAQSNDPSKSIVAGDILDESGSKAVDSNGVFYPSSKSFWTTSSSDGGEVETGGVGQVLQNRASERKIYTLLPGDPEDEDDGPDGDTSFDLTNSWNAFTTGNSRLTHDTLDVSSGERDNLIKFVRGIDVYDDNVNGSTTDKRNWMLGSFLHSRPFVIPYAGRTVIFAGANDGMLHAFNESDGEELWAFIPPCLLDRLKELHTETPGMFVDGSPKAYVTYDADGNVTKAILIFGLRRGGNYYYALDVTNPLVPKYLWRIYRDRPNQGEHQDYYQELGQTWSTPVIGKVAYGTGEKWVAIFGAGYDEGQDATNPNSDNIGRGVYMADVLTGDCVWYKSHAGGYSSMTYSIPSDVVKVDLDGDGKIDRLYVGDMNSRIFRFDIGNLNSTGSWTARKIFEPDTVEKRKIFYPPDVTFEKDSTGEYEMLFFGTGDREDPKAYKGIKNRLYALKDRNASGTLGLSDLVNVTTFYTLNASQQAAKIADIKTNDGWYIELEQNQSGTLYGEKCLASPVVYNKTAYFTTFSPTSQVIGDICFVGEGTAFLYAVNYATGEAVFNFDLTNDSGGIVKSKSDRSLTIGTAIPSGVVVTVIGGKVTAYVGMGGGVYKPTLPSTRSIFPTYWRLIF